MTVHEMRDGSVRRVSDCVPDLAADGGRSVNEDHAFRAHEEEGLIYSFGDRVGAAAEVFDGPARRPNWGKASGGWKRGEDS